MKINSLEIQDKQDVLFSSLLCFNIFNTEISSNKIKEEENSPSAHGVTIAHPEKKTLFDLRALEGKSLLGHSHPIYIKSILDTTNYTTWYIENPQSTPEYKSLCSSIQNKFKHYSSNIEIEIHYELDEILKSLKLKNHIIHNIDCESDVSIHSFDKSNTPYWILQNKTSRHLYLFFEEIAGLKLNQLQGLILKGPFPFYLKINFFNNIHPPKKMIAAFDLIYSFKLIRYLFEGNFLGTHGRLKSHNFKLIDFAKKIKKTNIYLKASGTSLLIMGNNRKDLDNLIQTFEQNGLLVEFSSELNAIEISFPLSITPEQFDEVFTIIVQNLNSFEG